MNINWTMLRRVFCTLLGFGLCIVAGYQYAWHENEISTGDSFESLGLLALVIAALGVYAWLVFGKAHQLKTVLAIILTAAVVIVGNNVLDGIKTGPLLVLLGVLLGAVVLVALIVIDDLRVLARPFRLMRRSRSAQNSVGPVGQEYVDPEGSGSAYPTAVQPTVVQ